MFLNKNSKNKIVFNGNIDSQGNGENWGWKGGKFHS